MDSSSISASTVALLQLTLTTIKYLDGVRGVREASADRQQLSLEMT